MPQSSGRLGSAAAITASCVLSDCCQIADAGGEMPVTMRKRGSVVIGGPQVGACDREGPGLATAAFEEPVASGGLDAEAGHPPPTLPTRHPRHAITRGRSLAGRLRGDPEGCPGSR